MDAEIFPRLKYLRLALVNRKIEHHKGFRGSFTACLCYSDRYLAQAVASPEP